ncbi:MAG: VOC family protein [Pseudomonadota bacterium]
MTLDAVLDALDLCTPRLAKSADFYALALQCEARFVSPDTVHCSAPGRELRLRQGDAHRLHASQFRLASPRGLSDYARRFEGQAFAQWDVAHADGPRLTLTDPEGRLIRFHASASTPAPQETAGTWEARLQHYAVRTPDPERLVRFYVEQIGFVASDFVRDADGVLRAAFLRTDHEHHSLAIFHAPQVRFDHFSCETRDWHRLRDWADHMGRQSISLVWGVGRHGPGNDTFFLVADPDGNLAEISCDLESCEDDRPAGLWAHHPSTLNQWGMAIMRS